MSRVTESMMFNAIAADMDCIIEIDNENGRYYLNKVDDVLAQIFDSEGSLEDLYRTLFFTNEETNGEIAREYYRFMDTSFFSKDKHKGMVNMKVKGVLHVYFFNMLSVSENQAILMFSSAKTMMRTENEEIQKIDSIQKIFLFSMVIDLSNDECSNAVMPGYPLEQQDMSKLSFSEWRLKISDTFKEEDRPIFFRATERENMINTLELRPEYHFDVQMMNMVGKWQWVRISFRRMMNFSREYPKVVYTVEDISEDMEQLMKQENLVKAIESQNRMLVEADKQRMLFFASLSHEIRTPINSILGMNEVIIRDSTETSIVEYAQDVKTAGRILLSLVNDIMDYSKIEVGKMEIVPVEYKLRDMVENVKRLIFPKVAEKALGFNVSVDEDVPRVVFGDEIRVSQILINILSNAVKYTDAGYVALDVKMGPKNSAGLTQMQFAVSDTGTGIKAEDIQKLFDDYSRLDMQRNRNVEGTGLGLGIVSGLVNQMGGKINVTSEYGEGTVFTVTIPQKIVDGSAIDEKRMAGIDGNGNEDTEVDYASKKILVVDDTVINLKVFGAMLAPYGMTLVAVESGQEALSEAAKEHFDIVFLDHLMPEMDGVETLHRMRQIPGYEDATIIALTGNYSSTAKVEYQSMGFTDYMQKPVLPEVMSELLVKYL